VIHGTSSFVGTIGLALPGSSEIPAQSDGTGGGFVLARLSSVRFSVARYLRMPVASTVAPKKFD
jgi:hypothetical protein